MNIVSILRRGVDRIAGGRGEHSITVPVMDGALKPNDRLERAASVAKVGEADNILAIDGRLLCSSGNRVLAVGNGDTPELVAEVEGPISCLASDEQGALAIGIDGKGVRLKGGRHDGVTLDKAASATLSCPTAALFLDSDRLVVTNGSSQFPAAQWRHDLLHRNSGGSVILVDLARGDTRTLASGLAFPSGVCAAREDLDHVLISEAWRHRILRLNIEDRTTDEVLAALPAYPGRMARAGGEGYWLACFAPRSQLQEFVLRENRYRRAMIEEVDPEFWIAPALSSGKSFKEPLQAGGVIRLGVHKPWAPTRSYGLVVRLNNQLQPVWSLHSRANGVRHGITSVVEFGGRLLATSKGRGEIVAFAHTSLDEPDDHQPVEDRR